jgi:predicted RNA-binding protein with PIN domain
VFDGWKTGSHREEHAVTGGVRVIYSRLGDRADDVIRKIISQERKEWIVITSDREIASHAWAEGSVPVSSDQFLRRLGQDNASQDEIYGSPQDEEGDRQGKGNPRQLSKKEKALIRVLRKL